MNGTNPSGTAPAEEPQPVLTRKPKVLLVEDDVFMVDLLVHEFSKAGFDTAIAKTGKEGVEKFSQWSPDVILFDILLPDQNGLETLRQIRRLPGGPEVKALILSNLAETEEIQESKRLGAIDYMVKANFTLPEIVEKVKTVLAPH